MFDKDGNGFISAAEVRPAAFVCLCTRPWVIPFPPSPAASTDFGSIQQYGPVLALTATSSATVRLPQTLDHPDV